MIDVRKFPRDGHVIVDSIEYDGDVIFYGHDNHGEYEARIRLTHEEVALAMGYTPREIRVEYGDSGEDYITEYFLDDKAFTRTEYLDHHVEVAMKKLSEHVMEKFNTSIYFNHEEDATR